MLDIKICIEKYYFSHNDKWNKYFRKIRKAEIIELSFYAKQG